MTTDEVITDDWYDESDSIIWPICKEWAELHGIDERELSGIFEWQGEGAWYPPDDEPITKKLIFKWCAVNYGWYRFSIPPAEDDLYDWPVKEEDK